MVWAMRPFRFQTEEGTSMSDANIFKCHCNYHLDMGPNLQCPVHGSRENLFAGVVSRRNERERTRASHLVAEDDLKKENCRLRKLLTDVKQVNNSRVVDIMIEQRLEAKDAI